MVHRLTTLATVTAFVSAIGTPAVAQERRPSQTANTAATTSTAQAAQGRAAARDRRRGQAQATTQTTASTPSSTQATTQNTQPAGGAAQPSTPTAQPTEGRTAGRGRRRGQATPTTQATTPTTQPAEDPTVTEARREYDLGRQALTANQPEEALRHFQRAYELRANPVVWVAIAQSQVQLGRIADAIATFERYLRERPDAPDRTQIEQQLAELRRRPATVHVESNPPGARISIDGRDTGQVTPADVPAEPGRHTVRLELAGYTAHSQEIDTAPGGRTEVRGDLTAETTTPAMASLQPEAAVPATEERAARRVSPVVWVATSVAGAGLVAGTVLGFLALGELSEYNALPPGDPRLREIRDRGENYALLSDVSFGVSVLGAAVAAVVYFSSRSEPVEPPRAALRAPHTRPGVHIAPAGLVVTF